MLLQAWRAAAVVHPPRWLVGNTVSLTVMGSQSCGVSGGSSDMNICNSCVPPEDMVFLHPAGEVAGSSTPGPRFKQWQRHQVCPPDGRDISCGSQVFGIVRQVQLCMRLRLRADWQDERREPGTGWEPAEAGQEPDELGRFPARQSKCPPCRPASRVGRHFAG